MKIPNLKEIYDSGQDLKDSYIPDKWRDSFNKFIYGSACSFETNEDGTFKELIYYACDFKQWYRMNQQSIERDIKIDKVIDNVKG